MSGIGRFWFLFGIASLCFCVVNCATPDLNGPSEAAKEAISPQESLSTEPTSVGALPDTLVADGGGGEPLQVPEPVLDAGTSTQEPVLPENLPEAAPIEAGDLTNTQPEKGAPTRRSWTDVSYASVSKSQVLDIYLPAQGAGPFPVIAWVHGGGWKTGSKSLSRNAPQLGLLEKGFAVVSIEYRLSGEATFPAQIHDVKTAIRFLRANKAKYFLDTSKIGAWGNSAGGHLVSLLGTSGGEPTLEGEALGYKGISSRVQAVVDWYGPISFLEIDADLKRAGCQVNRSAIDLGSAYSNLLGAAIDTVPNRVKQADPSTYITKDDPPFLISQGDKDCTVPYPQSLRFRDALRKVLGTAGARFRMIKDATHTTKDHMTTDNLGAVFSFFVNQLKP